VKRLTADRLLQSQGYGTRRWCQQLISAGEFSVDGETHRDPRALLDPQLQRFSIFGEPLVYRPQVYLALNKPAGYECSRKATHHPGVLTLLPEQMRWRDVQPVGRLDHDTTGLLLLSDDGGFIHRQASPRHQIAKRYRARLAVPADDALVAHLLAGVALHDEPVPLAAVACLRLNSHELELSLTEGKYHQVKRMLAAAGNHCIALSRVAIGGLRLEVLELAEGAWCHLGDDQLALLSASGHADPGDSGAPVKPA
jgi:16S rRNA pseudouridine516 synthase